MSDHTTDPAALADFRSDGNLLAHLLRFTRLLRLMGVSTSFGQTISLVDALPHVPLTDKRDFYMAARALLLVRHEDYPIFDQAFQLYWRRPERVRSDLDPDTLDARQKLARLPSLPHLLSEIQPEDSPEADRPSYSQLESLRTKDFAQMTWEEIEAAKRVMRRMAWPISQRQSRRIRAAHRGHRLAMRRLLRDNLRYGGEPLLLRWQERRIKPRPLVVLCDISGSMERYSRMLLHFLHALNHRMDRVESFVFGTRLTRISHHLRHRDVDESLAEVGEIVADWSGGTRIGESIRRFNFDWARRTLGRGAVVLIISDGWDRGDPDDLAREMQRLQRSAHRLIWLNPLLGHARYEPIQRGMAAALPFVDDFLPVHNLQSMAQLAERLASLGEQRPSRRQSVQAFKRDM
ncbi:MAG: VWA domain-containing protein [Ardenticatenales bacterium]|nr:VWA domain-containing protein [Ardenticatenales bacterium]